MTGNYSAIAKKSMGMRRHPGKLLLSKAEDDVKEILAFADL
jgi:hypothetical protein